ncbi:hypothetical protein Q9L58_008104 [Maublancomyces gigas]|uniref:Uncharacterized protein n=1 Tax=Discina gigas TaxID=1032678 RepID=A0ABR3GAL3_9PEZI
MCPHHLRCIKNTDRDVIHRNVNLLVPIAAHKIGTQTISDYKSRGFTPILGFEPKNGIDIDDDHRKLILEAPNENNDQDKRILDATDNNHQQLNRILEATASLAVADARLQVVAVALHIDNTSLTIAENRDVSPGLAKHIEDLWGQLFNLERKNPTEGEKLDFLKSAYCYSVSKNLKRYNKWVPRLSLFLSAVSAITATEPFIEEFRRIVESLKAMHGFLREMETKKNLEKEQWKTVDSFEVRNHLIEHMSKANWEHQMQEMDRVKKEFPLMLGDFEKYYSTLDWDRALKQLEDQPGHDKLSLWVDSVKAHPDPGLLGHAYDTLTTQHRHITRLLSAPAKPFLSRLFESKMKVIKVPGTDEVDITLPTDEPGLSRLIRAMYESVKPWIPTDSITLEVDKLLPELKKTVNSVANSVVNGVVHCECALVAYLEDTNNPDKTETDVWKQYNYIGVSKPSCGACNAWLTAFNETHDTGRTWYTSGCHGKWYKNWMIPPAFNIEKLKDEMAKIVCQEFVRYCNPRVHDNTHDHTGSINPRTGTRK